MGDTPECEGRLHRVVILSGITGIGFSHILDYVKRGVGGLEGGCVVKFEDYLRLHGPCHNVSDLVALYQYAGQGAEREFREAACRMIEDLKRRGCRCAVIAAHTTYMIGSDPSTIPNPALDLLTRMAENVSFVSVVEDWYDSIKRIADRARARQEGAGCPSRPSGFGIDHERILAWRQVDINVAQTALRYVPNGRWFLLAAKHPRDTIVALVDYLLGDCGGTRPEGARQYVLAYFSHPISSVRRYHLALRALIARAGCRTPHPPPLGVNILATLIEGFKGFLKRRYPTMSYYQASPAGEGRGERRLILFEPTTVDELMSDCFLGHEEVMCWYILPPLFAPDLRWPFGTTSGHQGGDGDEIARRYLWWRRWLAGGQPASLTTLKDELSETYDPGIFNLFKGLIGHLKSGIPGRGALEAYYARNKPVIDSQIEMRDYAYVNQSDVVIALLPVLVVLDPGGDRGKNVEVVWSESKGVINEIHRAFALGKQMTAFILPITEAAFLEATRAILSLYLEASRRASEEDCQPVGDGVDTATRLAEIARLVFNGYRRRRVAASNLDDTVSLDQLASKLQADLRRGGPFPMLPKQAKMVVLPPITRGDIEFYTNELARLRDRLANGQAVDAIDSLTLYRKFAVAAAEAISRKEEVERTRVIVWTPLADASLTPPLIK